MQGTLNPDFTIRVVYEAVGIDPSVGRVRESWGTATLKIDLTDATRLTVRVVGEPKSPMFGSSLHTTEWARVSDVPIYPPPTPNP